MSKLAELRRLVRPHALAFVAASSCLATLTLLLAAAGVDKPKAKAGAKKEAVRVLFVGNSYTSVNDLPAVVRAFGLASKPPIDLVVEAITPGGMTLEGHAAATGKDSVKARLEHGAFDVVVLQEQSQRPLVEPDTMLAAAKELATAADKATTRVVWYATWARAGKPEQQEGLDAAYTRCRDACGGTLALVGDAWQRVLSAKEPKDRVALHDTDGSHPTVAGTYLAGLVVFAAITGREVDGLPARLTAPGTAKGEDRVLADLEPRTAKILQQAAPAPAKAPAK